MKFDHKKTRDLHTAIIQSLYLTRVCFHTGTWQTDGQVDGRMDRITIAIMCLALRAVACNKLLNILHD